ncbi:MAG: hypothetical protein ABI614_19510, partial [Planctomycetota bacterium]
MTIGCKSQHAKRDLTHAGFPAAIVACFTLLVVCNLLPRLARADLVMYRVPGINKVVPLQGATTVNQGG